ncbi:MAG: hypothetical protein JXR51_14495 [Bacteroidales bacterium]|nr:hypothetical protein [Bacteroidales bacterium]MBN2758380.1 hypothetical protein [Bacteroidales bacterium]
MKKNLILLSLILINYNYSIAQRWRSERHSLVGGIGTTFFLGDLGGGSKDAAHFFGVRDLDFVTTRPLISINYRFRIIEQVAAKAGFTWGILSATDEASASIGRKLRNLSFTSNIWQFNIHGEYYFVKEKDNPRYSFSSLRSIRNISAYAFTGFSVLYFNPKAKLDGVKYALQPLGTEGQGIEGNPPLYSKIALGWPIGLGAKYSLTRKLAVGIEISNTYTNSDYIDDAHDKYYDNGAIGEAHGSIAAILADRHIDADGNDLPAYVSGTERRGSPNFNDAYIFTTITLTYKLKRSNTGLPKF